MKRVLVAMVVLSMCLVDFTGTALVENTGALAGTLGTAFAASPAGKVVKIGGLWPLTGSVADLGGEHMRGATYAVERINGKEGGIKSLGGAKIELVLGDSKSDKTEGVAEAEKLITRDDVLAISGAYQSAVTLPSCTIAQRNRVPYLVDSAISNEISQRGFDWVFRPCTPSIGWASGQFDFLNWLNKGYANKMGGPLKTLGLLYENTAYGQSTAGDWKKFAKEKGFTIVIDLPYSTGSTDLTSEINRLKGAKPDVVLMVSYASDAILIANTMAEIKYSPRVILTSGGGHSTREFQQAVGKKIEGLFNMIGTWNLDVKTQFNEFFPAEYEKRWKEKLSSHSAQGGSNVYILRDALEIAGVSAGGWDAWNRLSLQAKRDAVRKALVGYKSTNSPPVFGYESTMEFKTWENWTNQNPNWSPGIVQFKGGSYRSVFPEGVAAAKPVFK